MLSCNDSDFVDYLFEVSYQAKGGLTLAECRYLVATKQVTLAADCSLLPLTYFKA